MRRALILLGVAIGCAYGQSTSMGGRTMKGDWDASNARTTKPAKAGTALPGACSTGEAFFKTDATGGQNLYLCKPDNTWTQLSGGGGAAGAIACIGTPGNTAGSYRQQCQTTAGALYACNNAAGCTVAGDWVAVGGGGGVSKKAATFLLCVGSPGCYVGEFTNLKFSATEADTVTGCQIDAMFYPTGTNLTIDILKNPTIGGTPGSLTLTGGTTIFSSTVSTLAAGSSMYSTQSGMAAAAALAPGDYLVAKVLTADATVPGWGVNLTCTVTY